MGTEQRRKLKVPVRGWVDILLYSYHRKIAHELEQISLEFDRNGNRILEIGAGKKPCKELFQEASFTCTDVVSYDWVDELIDANKMPYKENSFDLVICNNVLEHVPTPQQAVDEIHRCLKPRGKLFLVVPFLFPLHDVPHDYFRFTEYSLANLFEKWCVTKIQSISYFGWLGNHLHAQRFVLYYVVSTQK